MPRDTSGPGELTEARVLYALVVAGEEAVHSLPGQLES